MNGLKLIPRRPHGNTLTVGVWLKGKPRGQFRCTIEEWAEIQGKYERNDPS